MLPPGTLMTLLNRLMVPMPLPAGFKTTDSGWALPSEEILAPKNSMSRSALSVKVTGSDSSTLRSAPENQKMSPGSLPPMAAVVRLTLFPASSALWMVPTQMNAESPVVVKSGPPLMLESKPEPSMYRSFGSINHSPGLPRGAVASMEAGRASIQPPDVSMKPPSPPCAPPRAENWP